MTTDIGKTDSSYIIDDTSTYRWYLSGAEINWHESDEPLMFSIMEEGIVNAITGFTINNIVQIKFVFTSLTHYQNWIKARGYWRKNGSKLTLHVENELGHISQYSPYDDPTTLENYTGILKDINIRRQPAAIEVTAKFLLATEVDDSAV